MFDLQQYQTDVSPGTRWQHRNGVRYTVLFIANSHTEFPDKYPATVVYIGPNGRLWARTLEGWYKSMTKLEN